MMIDWIQPNLMKSTAAQTHQCHRALLLEEVLLRIFRYAPPHALAAAALTCRAWYDLALSALWTEVDVVNVLEVLGPTMEGDNGCLVRRTLARSVEGRLISVDDPSSTLTRDSENGSPIVLRSLHPRSRSSTNRSFTHLFTAQSSPKSPSCSSSPKPCPCSPISKSSTGTPTLPSSPTRRPCTPSYSSARPSGSSA